MSSFEDAVVRLNSRNLLSLWRLCSYLSSVEIFSTEASPIFPLWNCEKERLLCQAVILSTAAPYKSGLFTLEDLRYVINAANDALHDSRLEEEIPSGGQRAEMLYKLRRFFARTANVQLRPQEPRLLITAGQLVAMLSTLPRESLCDFPEHYRDLACTIANEVESTLRGSIFEYFRIHLSICSLYEDISQKAFSLLAQNPPSRPRRMERPDERQARFFNQLVSFFPAYEKKLHFTAVDLKRITSMTVREDAVDSYLAFFASNTRKLRELAGEKAYKHGPIGWRLSPLERFPIVDLGSSTYCVPNIRTFIRSFGDVIHFSLQDALGNRYNTFRGISQEVFIQKLVSKKLALGPVIQERPYKKSVGEFRGPDLALVEEPGPQLIVIESKGKRLLARTRFTMTEEAVDQNYDVAYSALQKLPVKIYDLLHGLPEYSDVQPDLNATKGNQPFAVIVLGEAAYMLTLLLRYRAENDHDHPLHDYPFPVAVMGPETFEMAVEHASQESSPLYRLLSEFWEDSAHLELNDPMPETFRGRPLHEPATFAASFLEPLSKEAGLVLDEEI